MTSFEETYDPIGDTMTLGVLAGTVVSLAPGQSVRVHLRHPQPQAGTAGAGGDGPAVSVTNFGHGVRLIEVPALGGLDGEGWPGERLVGELAERGFTAPTGCPDLVGDPQAWQWAFGIGWAGVAGEQLLWLLEEMQRQPGGDSGLVVDGATLIDGGEPPNLRALLRHFPPAD